MIFTLSQKKSCLLTAHKNESTDMNKRMADSSAKDKARVKVQHPFKARKRMFDSLT